MTTGERVKSARKKAGMTQEELAEKVGYRGKSMISRIESGKNNPSFGAVIKISAVLNVPASALVFFNDEETSKAEEDGNVAETIVRLRKQNGLTQSELAEMTGLTRSAIGMYETGEREPSIATMKTLARFFGVSMDTLTGFCANTNGGTT